MWLSGVVDVVGTTVIFNMPYVRYGSGHKSIQSTLWVINFLLHKSRIHYVINTINSQRSLGDSGHYDNLPFALRGWLENPGLHLAGEKGVDREDDQLGDLQGLETSSSHRGSHRRYQSLPAQDRSEGREGEGYCRDQVQIPPAIWGPQRSWSVGYSSAPNLHFWSISTRVRPDKYPQTSCVNYPNLASYKLCRLAVKRNCHARQPNPLPNHESTFS